MYNAAAYLCRCPGQNWVHVMVFATIIAGMAFVILYFEYSHLGLIRIKSVERVLLDSESVTGRNKPTASPLGLDNYNRAIASCLEALEYSVK